MRRSAWLVCAVLAGGCATTRAGWSPDPGMKAGGSVLLVTPNVQIVSDDGALRLNPQAPANMDHFARCDYSATPQNYDEGERQGGMRVRIYYPGLPQPLFGILSLCEIDEGFMGPAARSYRIDVPQSYVDATQNGLAAMLYENYEFGGQMHNAWVLWIAREPFPGGAPAAK